MMAMVLFIILGYYMNRELNNKNIYLISQDGLIMFFSVFLESFLVLVLSVPEGLPLILSLSMTKCSEILKSKNIVVRRMETCYVVGCI